MRNKVYIRSDGSPQIGLGHIVRSLALAQMLRNEFEVTFFSIEIPDGFIKEITNEGFKLKKIVDENEFFTELTGNEIVVLDHYGLDLNYQIRIKDLGCKLVSIDDIHDNKFISDLIINHSPGISPRDYKAESYTQFALGLNYALLRPAFQTCGENLGTRLPNSLFICFGGSDPKNLTRRSLEVVLSTFKFETIIVVVGDGYDSFSNLKIYVSKFPNVTIFKGVDEFEMVKLMQSTEIALVPSSGILLEALYCGMQIISGMYVKNQKNFYNNYRNADLFVDAKDFSSNNIKSALENIKLKNVIPDIKIANSSKVKILKLFRNLKEEDFILLRSAKIEDIEITFKWAQDPKIRSFSFSKNKIQFKDHQLWFLNKLDSKECYYLIAEYNKEVLGSIRFDITDDTATISYLVDPEYQGKGFGIVLLKKGFEELKKNFPGVKEVVGLVLKTNIGSIKAFKNLGYKESILKDKFVFTKKIKI